MAYRKKSVYIVTIICFCLLSACQNGVPVKTNLETGSHEPVLGNELIENNIDNTLKMVDGCIEPFETFEYKMSPDDTKPKPGISDIVTPGSPWNIETDIDTSTLSNGYSWLRSKVIGVNSLNGNYEIWIENEYYYANSTLFHQTISIYKPHTKQWKTVDIDFGVIESDYSYISKLFFGSDGTVWGVVTSQGVPYENHSISILSKYDDKNNKFVFDDNVNGIPKYATPPTLTETMVLFDKDDIFWFVVPGDSIYRYDPSEKKVSNEISISSFNTETVTQGQDKSIYILTYYSVTGLISEDSIYKYSPQSHQLEKISAPEEVRYFLSYSRMLVDKENNLWLDSSAWVSPDGEWSRIIQPTIFISNFAEGFVPRLRVPQIQTQTSDDRLWFVGDNGSFWLDKDNQKWCWFTTYEVVPFEDGQEKLWFITNDHLYWSYIKDH